MSAQSQKHALLIGINTYPNFPANQLNGCVNDIEAMHAVLQSQYGFPEANIKSLKNEEATRDGILGALTNLGASIGHDDIVVIHYSGHGSQMIDREGDETDGKDETIVPHDSGRTPDENRDITDDELHLFLLEMSSKTPNVTFIVDSCHSGTIYRALEFEINEDTSGTVYRWVPPDYRTIDQLPLSPIPLEKRSALMKPMGSSGWFPVDENYTVISACNDPERAAEFPLPDGTKHGLLTHVLSLTLLKAAPGLTYQALLQQVGPGVTSLAPDQHPQFEGHGDAVVFGSNPRPQTPAMCTPTSTRVSSRAVDFTKDGPVTLNHITLAAPGLAGTARYLAPNDPEEPPLPEMFRKAFESASIASDGSVLISETRELSGSPTLTVTVTTLRPKQGQFLLYQNERGVLSWHFPQQNEGLRDLTDSGVGIYRIPMHAHDPVVGTSRGLLGSIGEKLLRAFVFPLVDPALGQLGSMLVRKWECANRPHRLRTCTPTNYKQPTGAEPNWGEVASGRALLLIHGTFSATHCAFCGMDGKVFGDLYNLYGGRVFGFDHPTLATSPRANVEWLLSHLPENTPFDLDIICHSRGGLVARMLTEQLDNLSVRNRKVLVRKVVFAGTPNAGTPIADAKYMDEFIGTFTNMLELIPIQAADILAGILAVAKHLAINTEKALEGIQSMCPDGSFLRELNQQKTDNQATYYCLASDFSPNVLSLKEYVEDCVMDQVFHQKPNDLVVPADSTYNFNKPVQFPIDPARRHVFDKVDGVDHEEYFSNDTACNKIIEWLT